MWGWGLHNLAGEPAGGGALLLERALTAFRAQHRGLVAQIREALAVAPRQGEARLHLLTGLAGSLGADRVCAVPAELEGTHDSAELPPGRCKAGCGPGPGRGRRSPARGET